MKTGCSETPAYATRTGDEICSAVRRAPRAAFTITWVKRSR
jgi:hypothetical protein